MKNKRYLSKSMIEETFVFLFVLGLCVFNLAPILWMFLTSFKLPSDVYHISVKLLPTTFSLCNYETVLADPKIKRYFLNSIFIAVSTVVLGVFIGLIAGYSLSRYRFPGKKGILVYILYTMVFPRTVIILPLYLLLVKMRLQGTYQGLILTYLMVVLPLSIWLFISFFKTIPGELEDAARIDGCNTFQLLVKIIVPLVKPGIFAVTMYSFIQAWNEYLFALVLSSSRTAPITVGLVGYLGEVGTQWGPIMAVSSLMILPTVVIFNAFGKYLAKGLVTGAVKG